MSQWASASVGRRCGPPRSPGIVAAGALLTTALFFGDGTSGGRLFWIGSLSVIAAVVLLWARAGATDDGAAALALLAALTLWVGLTMWSSIAPGLSWAAFDRLLAYCAFALLGLLACRVERPAPAPSPQGSPSSSVSCSPGRCSAR